MTIIVALGLFALLPGAERNQSAVPTFFNVLEGYLIFILFWPFYVYSASDKPSLALLFPVLVVSIFL